MCNVYMNKRNHAVEKFISLENCITIISTETTGQKQNVDDHLWDS